MPPLKKYTATEIDQAYEIEAPKDELYKIIGNGETEFVLADEAITAIIKLRSCLNCLVYRNLIKDSSEKSLAQQLLKDFENYV